MSAPSQPSAITKREWSLLGKLFSLEVETALRRSPFPPMLQSKAKAWDLLAERDLVERLTVEHRDRFGTMTMTGWVLTTRGHFHYCSNCERFGGPFDGAE